MWICNKCGGFFIIYKKSVIKEEFKIDKEGNEIDLPLKHELIENEDDVSYICTTCGRIYLKCISNIQVIAIWKEKKSKRIFSYFFIIKMDSLI